MTMGPPSPVQFATFTEANGIKHLGSAPYQLLMGWQRGRSRHSRQPAIKISGSGVALEVQISRFLFQYRLTPHSMTGVSPAELLMNRRPRSRLDLLHPDVSGRVRRKQEQQKATHDRCARKRSFKVGDLVSVKNQVELRGYQE